MRPKFVLLAVVMCGGVLCAASTRASPPPDVDGVYRGTRTLTRQMIASCGTPSDQASAVIKGGVIERNFMARDVAVSLRAEVQPDGSFSDQQGKSSISGHVGRGQLEFDLSVGERCGWHFALQRK